MPDRIWSVYIARLPIRVEQTDHIYKTGRGKDTTTRDWDVIGRKSPTWQRVTGQASNTLRRKLYIRNTIGPWWAKRNRLRSAAPSFLFFRDKDSVDTLVVVIISIASGSTFAPWKSTSVDAPQRWFRTASTNRTKQKLRQKNRKQKNRIRPDGWSSGVVVKIKVVVVRI